MFITSNIDINATAHLSGRILEHGAGPLQLERIVSSDGYSHTYQAFSLDSGSRLSRYHVKCLPKPKYNSGVLNLQRREFNLHKRASAHPNALTLHHIHDEHDSEFNYMVLDAPSAQVLQDAIPNKLGDEEWIRSTFLQVLDIVEHLHNDGIFHRNINPGSFFCDDNGHVHLAHFQMATTVGRSNERFCNAQSYRSPDMFKNDEACHKANDFWALGVLLFQLLTGITPWREANKKDPNFAIFASGSTWLLDGFGFSTETTEIIEGLLSLDPGQRSNIQVVRKAILRMSSFKAPIAFKRLSIMPSLSASSSTDSLEDEDSPVTPETIAVDSTNDDIPVLSMAHEEFGGMDEVTPLVELTKARPPNPALFRVNVGIV